MSKFKAGQKFVLPTDLMGFKVGSIVHINQDYAADSSAKVYDEDETDYWYTILNNLTPYEEKTMTPCEEKGYKVGQVFEVVKTGGGANALKGDIIILTEDDGTSAPFFAKVKATPDSPMPETLCKTLSKIVRIYPPEEKEPVETITLMGKTYNKAEIEKALADVLPVS